MQRQTSHESCSAPGRRLSAVELDASDSDVSYRAVPRNEDEADDAERQMSTETVGSFGIPIKKKTVLQQCVESTSWQCIVVTLTLTNGIVIGFETDYPQMTRWDIVENAFVFGFLLELCIKIVADGPRYYFKWSSSEFGWNMFDVSIVTAGVLDMVIDFGDAKVHQHGKEEGSPATNFATAMRMFRLLRVLRLLRIVRYLKKLYLLVFGLMEAAKAVIWITMLMSFILYVCSVILVHTVGRLPGDAPHAEFMTQRFGTVEAAMLTLFQFMSSPTLMEYEKGDLMGQYPLLISFLVVWIIFGSFGIVAMLTGVISESIFDKNQLWMNEMRSEKEDMHKEIKRWCRKKFDEVPVNENCEAAVADIVALLPALEHLADDLGVEYTHHDIKKCIKYMDHDNSGAISFSEFAHTIVNMLEGDSHVSNQELKHSVHITQTHVEKMLNLVQNLHSESCTPTAKDRERKSTLRSTNQMNRVETLCHDVCKLMDTQQNNVRTISELAVAMGNTIQSMTDFISDMKRKDEAPLPSIIDRNEHPDVLKKSLQYSCEALTLDLSTKIARIDAVVTSLGAAQVELLESPGESYLMSDFRVGFPHTAEPKSIATIVQKEAVQLAMSMISAERKMILELIGQMRNVVGGQRSTADLPAIEASICNAGPGDTGGLMSNRDKHV